LSFDPVALGLKEADRTKLAAAVQTTRAIIAEYA
jgi:type IV secretion system protein VirD4